VTVAGRTPFKLELAAAYGADEVVLMTAEDERPGGARVAELAPDGFDVVIDATGSLEVLAGCAQLLGIGGTLFVYGMAPEAASLAISPYDVFRRELTIKGSFSQAFSFDRALALLRSGRVRTEGMVTHRFALPEYGARSTPWPGTHSASRPWCIRDGRERRDGRGRAERAGRPRNAAPPGYPDWIRAQLGGLLNFCAAAADWQDGGFDGLTITGRRQPGPKHLYATARMTYGFTLGVMLGRPGCAELAEHGLRGVAHDIP